MNEKTEKEESKAAYRNSEERVNTHGRGYEVSYIGPQDDHTSVRKVNQVHNAPDDRESYRCAPINTAEEDPVDENL